MLFTITKCNLTKAHFYCYSIPLEAIPLLLLHLFPFNKCLIFHYFYFSSSHILFSLFIICLFLSASLFVFFFCAHTELQLLLLLLLLLQSTRKHIKKPFGFDWLLFLGAYSFWVKSEHNNNNDYQKCFSPLHSLTSRCTFCTRFHKQLMAMKSDAMLRITICQRTSLRSLYFASSCK